MSDMRGKKLWHEPGSYVPVKEDRGDEGTGAGVPI